MVKRKGKVDFIVLFYSIVTHKVLSYKPDSHVLFPLF